MGKSSIIKRLVEGSFSDAYQATVGFDFLLYNVIYKKKNINYVSGILQVLKDMTP